MPTATIHGFRRSTRARLPRLRARTLEESSVPIGLLACSSYQQASIDLQSGDLLVCYSDGVTEAENKHGEFWEEEGAARVICTCNDMDVIPRLFHGCDEFAAGHEQSDDITVIAVRIE